MRVFAGIINLTPYSVSTVGAASQWHRPLACGLALGGETPPLQQIIEGVKYLIPLFWLSAPGDRDYRLQVAGRDFQVRRRAKRRQVHRE